VLTVECENRAIRHPADDLRRRLRKSAIASALRRIAYAMLGALLPAVAMACTPLARADGVFEEFNGPAGAAPDPNMWTRAAGSGWDSGLQDFAAPNAFLDGQGNLVLEADKTGGHYVSGRIQTKNKANIGYGRVSARMKIPAGQGLWPAFWLVGADEDQVPWPGCGEIDIIEVVSDPTRYYSTLHGPTAGRSSSQQVQLTGSIGNLSTGYHDYWVTHLPNSITFGIDGRVLGTFTPESLPSGAEWVFNRPMYAIFSLAVGGDWAGPPNESTDFPARLLVDSFQWEPA
jgi:beta-glucanase (GH16 family)